MNVFTARLNLPAGTPPLSASTFLILPVDGPVLLSLSVLSCLSTYDPTKSGFRVMDSGGRIIFPAMGKTDTSAVLDGRASYAPLMPLIAGWHIDLLNDELSGPPYNLKFEFYNEDVAAFFAMVHVGIGQDNRPLAVRVFNFEDLIQPIGGLVQHLVDRLFPPKD